jgi:4-amino-4-deoxy-L-arabinose transferase-like glycosyltransferase
MLETGNWMLPLLHGKPYLLKPLMNWLMAASGVIFGTLNEWTSRIPLYLLWH